MKLSLPDIIDRGITEQLSEILLKSSFFGGMGHFFLHCSDVRRTVIKETLYVNITDKYPV